MDKFYPRSFNMGVRAEVYKALGGFSKMPFGGQSCSKKYAMVLPGDPEKMGYVFLTKDSKKTL